MKSTMIALIYLRLARYMHLVRNLYYGHSSGGLLLPSTYNAQTTESVHQPRLSKMYKRSISMTESMLSGWDREVSMTHRLIR